MFQAPRQLIHIHPFSAEQDIPEYDMDSEDEEWVNQHAAKGEVPLTNLQFEEMMDRLEKVKSRSPLRTTLKEHQDWRRLCRLVSNIVRVSAVPSLMLD